MVVGGTRIVRMTPANSKLLPLNFNRAKPYPARAQDAVVKSVVEADSAKVLNSVAQ
ncbi:hypothetical protein D1872_306120 [compost metagenome]